MSAYFIVHYSILDRNRIDEVTALMRPIDEKYGAEVIVASPVKPLEGETYSSVVIYKFDSFEAAERWYYSEEQQEVKRLRTHITEGWAAIVPECAQTQALMTAGYFACKAPS